MYQELFFVCFFLEFFYQETFGFIILKKNILVNKRIKQHN